ncbi:MAG: ATP-grasp domain-containing protein [Patescibacteria group bacterium]
MEEFKKVQRKLKLNKRLANFNYRGERTFVVLSGLNHSNRNLKSIKGLSFYEERMLFFLFLLRYKRTKIIYITSKGFNKELFDYYLDLISDNEKDFLEKKKRLTCIEVDDKRPVALAQKMIDDSQSIEKVINSITDHKTALLRCYNPTNLERSLAVKLNVPLFASEEKHDFVGSKSGGRKVFKLSGANLIPGYSYLKNSDELFLAMARLTKKHPETKKMMVKINYAASGQGNCIFRLDDFIKKTEVIITKTSVESLSELIRRNFDNHADFEIKGLAAAKYLQMFESKGGIAELFISGETKYSPSVQISINAEGKPTVLSTHEQILGGQDKQKYLGCTFPSLTSHRKLIIKEGNKIAEWMAKKGIIGNFAIDFVVVHPEGSKNPIVYPIEINLRKGGTTHPFRIAFFLTGAKYNKNRGILHCGKVLIHYLSMDIIESEKYKKIKPMKLIELVHNSKISFNKNTKKGALVYMPGMVKEFGRFGAICIGHSDSEAKRIYNKMIKLIEANIELLEK